MGEKCVCVKRCGLHSTGRLLCARWFLFTEYIMLELYSTQESLQIQFLFDSDMLSVRYVVVSRLLYHFRLALKALRYYLLYLSAISPIDLTPWIASTFYNSRASVSAVRKSGT